MALSRSSASGLSDLLDQDVLSLKSSDLADSMLLAPFSQEETDEVEEAICTESSQPASPEYGDLLDIMARATTTLDLA